jgi:microcompartment protein CcmL/EutN
MNRAVLTLSLFYSGNISMAHADEVSKDILSHGASIIKLAVTIAKTPPLPSGDQYADLAEKLRYQVLTARAVGNVASSNANIIATALSTYAITSPEPITKIVAAAGAMAAKAQGEFIANTVVENSTKQSLKVLKKFLDDQQVTAPQLAEMNATEFLAFSKTLRSGNQTLSQALADVPGAEATIDAAAKDFMATKDAAMFLKIDQVNESVDQLKDGLRTNTEAVKKLQNMVQATNRSLLQLKDETVALRDDVKELKNAVAGNTSSIRSLIEVSSMSWSPGQKLAAVEAGLFKDLVGPEKEKLIKSLQTEIRRDNLIGELSLRGRQLGQLANIASGLGVAPHVVDAMVKGQQLANTAVAFVSGDYLAAASSVVSMFGGSRDAAAERHAQMMQYLAEQFRQVNVKLEEIKKLQEETLQQTVALRQDVFELRQAMDAGFKRIEDQIYLSQELSRKLIKREWEPCDYLLTQLNGYPSVQSVSALKRLLSIQVQDNLVACYSGTNNSFSLWTNPDRWPASIIDSTVFNSDVPTTDPAALAAAKAYADAARSIFADTREFVLTAMPRDQLMWELSRFALPASYAQQSERVELDKSVVLPAEDCSVLFVELPALLRIACYEYDPFSKHPDPRRTSNILSPTLIGPMAPATIDMAILMSDMADLFLKRGPGAATSYSFADSVDIDELMQGKVNVAASQRLRVANTTGRNAVRRVP